MAAGTPLYTADGKLVGVLKGSTLHKTVRGSKHKFRSVGDNGSWGIDYDVLFKKLPERGLVYINDEESGTLYMGRVSQWKDYGIVMHFKEDTVDHYVQVFLPVEYFDKTTRRR